MHVIAQIRRDEVVVCLGIMLQVGNQLAVGPYMSYTVGRIWIVGVRDIVEENHRIVLGGI